jgi:hypothetical protein
MEFLKCLIEMMCWWIQGKSLLIATLCFWGFFAIGVYFKKLLYNKSDDVDYAKSRDIMDLRYWCWVNYAIGVTLLLLYLYKLNWG